MTSHKLNVRFHRPGNFIGQNDVLLSETFVKAWKIPPHQHITLRFGAVGQPIRVIPVRASSEMRISPWLADHFGLNANSVVRAAYRANRQSMQIGPLIGVLVNRVYENRPDSLFGKMTAFCRELTDACKMQGASVYFFTPDAIRLGNDKIDGWSYSGLWRKGKFPVPDIVHNRLTTRRLENKPSVQQFFKDVKSRWNGNVFNEKYLDKTDVFQALKKEAAVTGLLPESYQLKNFRMLKNMCAKYRVVFLKPARGSLGKGIIRIARSDDKHYVCHSTGLNGATKKEYASFTQLFSAISGKMHNTRYQIQQGINMIEASGRPIDFRALVQKNERGKWAITSIVARIAANSHFVSNLARGGMLCKVPEALVKSNLAPGLRKTVYAGLHKNAIEVAKALERQIPFHFGELGIDFAVEPGGKIWLLEVNSKPSKNDNTQLNDSKIRPSVKLLVHYSRFLTKL
ncbi:MAG TPA: YheC/YheD family protein [Bacilli bacterium]